MSAPTAVGGGTAPLAALTSIFTPPCPTSSWLLTTTRSFSQYPPFPTAGPAWCGPPSWRTNIAGAGFHYYSPAICPHGFVVGPDCGITKTRTDEGFPTIAPGETAVYCVPSGLTCTTDLTDYRGGVWGVATATESSSTTVYTLGPAIQIRWASTDLTVLETHPLTPGLGPQPPPRTDSPETQSATTTATAIIPVMGETTTTSGPATQTTGNVGTRAGPAADGGAEPKSSATPTDFDDYSNSFTHIFESIGPTGNTQPTNSADDNASGGIGSLNRTNSIIVIVVVTVVAGIILWIGAFLLVRRYKKKAAQRNGNRSPRSTKEGYETSLENGYRDRPQRRHTRTESGAPRSLVSPVSELDAAPSPPLISPAIGSTPNPAELEGDVSLQPPPKTWVHQRLWPRSPSQQHLLHSAAAAPLSSPRSTQSTRSARRTVRESFGEKVNDPAAALGRLRIPIPLSIGRPSPTSASPSARSFWRMPSRSPRHPTAAAGIGTPPSTAGLTGLPGAVAAARLSAQLPGTGTSPRPSPGLPKSRRNSVVNARASRASTPGRGKPGWQGDSEGAQV
ncbi:hypothetical protein B0J18DRAFT_30431 [Chaetomium sp. MPI-SDFR-AT-0129]|nr:hypothetical protein B0J18DRAFT_30431 [Chaetomium sp. MPI-SDFR-AT-0129]